MPRTNHIRLAAGVAAALIVSAHADQTLDFPRGELRAYVLESGGHGNPAPQARTVFRELIAVEQAAWIRLYFSRVVLGEGSFLRVTSLDDGEVQELDAAALVRWNDTTAYFNGSMVLLELVAGPGTPRNEVALEQVGFEIVTGHDGFCGICGNDDRIPSDEDWACRIMPVGCSGSVWNTDSCVVSAGHCTPGDNVAQFRVPPSSSNCALRNPPVADQFPITARQGVNGGVGNDWAVMTVGVNNLNELPYERYGVLRPLAPAPANPGDDTVNWGYGVDSECTRTQVQQTHHGPILNRFSNYYEFNIDATFGNSGSGFLKNDQIVGIVTHCSNSCVNFGTRIDHPSFAAARESLCPDPTPETFGPSFFNVGFGVVRSGGLDELQESDDERLAVEQRAAVSPLLPNVRVDVQGVASRSNISLFEFTLEARASALPANVPQRISMWNFASSSYEQLDQRTATTGDSAVTVSVTTNAGRFLSGGGSTLGRLEWFDPGAVFFVNWVVEIDQTRWYIEP